MLSFKQFLLEMKKPKWEVPAEPGTTPIPSDHVRLYHQTSRSAISPIRKGGIEPRQPVEGPRGIYAAKPDSKGRGFYDHPDYKPTIEFSVPKDDFKYPPFVAQDKVEPSSIIAGHKPWHARVRSIDSNPRLKAEVERGEHDHLLDDESLKGDDTVKAIRFIKKRAKSLSNN